MTEARQIATRIRQEMWQRGYRDQKYWMGKFLFPTATYLQEAYGLTKEQARIIVSDPAYVDYFECAVFCAENPAGRPG